MKLIARCGVLVALCLGPLPAFADTIGINEGHLEMNPSFGPLVLAGDRGFTFQSVVGVPDGRFEPLECNMDPLRCVPGATLSLLATWSGTDLHGTATLDGVSYHVDGFGPNSMVVLFNGQAVLPELAATAIVTAPFVFEGLFNHAPSSNVETVRDQLIGQGTATLSLSQSQNPAFPNSWRLSNARYDFAPVPEPSTVLLLAGGAAALLARRRRRKLL